MGKDTKHERQEKGQSGSVPDEEAWIRCGRCGYGLARRSARTEVDGKHVHTFVNPQGIQYTFGCWTEAPGCRGCGEQSTFFSWFAGFAWRIALCARCGTHVGWSFHAETRAFVGLIADRIV
jgi:hypothetical protein